MDNEELTEQELDDRIEEQERALIERLYHIDSLVALPEITVEALAEIVPELTSMIRDLVAHASFLTAVISGLEDELEETLTDGKWEMLCGCKFEPTAGFGAIEYCPKHKDAPDSHRLLDDVLEQVYSDGYVSPYTLDEIATLVKGDSDA